MFWERTYTLTSPKIDQNRPNGGSTVGFLIVKDLKYKTDTLNRPNPLNIPPLSAWNLRDMCGAYLARNII